MRTYVLENIQEKLYNIIISIKGLDQMDILDKTVMKVLLSKIKELDSVNVEEIVGIMLEIKQDDEKF